MTAISNTYEKPAHPIKVVATRTGLSKDVIRVWEKRYQAVNPQRSDTGRRLYTDADIAHLLKLKQKLELIGSDQRNYLYNLRFTTIIHPPDSLKTSF